MQDLGTLGGTYSDAVAVSGDVVVGTSNTGQGIAEYRAFAYDLGSATPTMQDLGTLGGATSRAVAVSGDVVVGLSNTSSGELHAAAWILSPPPVTATSTTLASSADPSIVGGQVTYTASVTPVADGGTIAFKDGATTITGCETQSIDASGQATCQVTHTSVGTRSITAEYAGNANYAASASSPLGQDVAYAIKLLYDPTKAGKGRQIVNLELQDAAQNNLSSSAITLTVTGLSPSPAPGTPPAGNFTFLASRKGASYQLLINTKNYPAATYTLSFTAGADPTTHTASFIVK
jgi:probable HAF family extracellular repeat protein